MPNLKKISGKRKLIIAVSKKLYNNDGASYHQTSTARPIEDESSLKLLYSEKEYIYIEAEVNVE